MQEITNRDPVQDMRRAFGTSHWLSTSPWLLIIEPGPAEKLMEFIGWLRSDIPGNRCEQGGLLIGYNVFNEKGLLLGGEVTHVLMAEADCRLPGYIEWSGMEEIRLQREFFRIQEETALRDPGLSEKLIILGWWHTHPNDLPVFMSGTDIATQKLKYYRPGQYSLVLNPHRGIFRAFHGSDALEAPVVMLLDPPVKEPAAEREILSGEITAETSAGSTGKKHRRKKRRCLFRRKKNV